MTSYTPLTQDIALSIARDFKSLLEKENIPVVDVYLFGSLAKGQQHKRSDIDIAVVHNTFSDDRMKERRTIRRLRKDKRYPMDILCFHPDDLDNAYYGLAQEVKRHGIVV